MGKKFLLVVLLYAVLSACALYAQQGNGSNCMGRTFSLEEIYSLAKEKSKVIQAGILAVSEAEEAVKEARNGRLPEIDLTLSASYLGNGCLTDRNFSTGQNIDMPHFGNNFAAEAVQLIYGGGAVNNGIALARLNRQMAGVNLNASESGVRFMLTGFYLNLFKLHNIIKVYDKNIALANRLVEQTHMRANEGVALENDITRHELRLKNLELARTRAINDANILNAHLVTLLELPQETYILPDSTLIESSLPVENENYWQKVAASEAYPLQQSSLAIKMGERQERLAKSERLPKLALVAANHFDGPITIEVPVIDKNFNYWYVGLGVSFKLSSLYKSGKTIRRAALATERSRRQYENAQEEVSVAVKADYIKYIEAYEEAKTLEKSLELANGNYDVIYNRYNNDIALITDMLDAANQKLEAELQLVNARINIVFNYYKLRNTAGTL